MTRVSTHTIVEETEHFVKQILTDELTVDHRYHNLPHTLAVRKACLEIAERLEIEEEEKEILELACLLHDTGFTEVYQGHEGISHRIARDFLRERGYPENRLQQVLRCIDATFPPNRPSGLLEKVIRDADLANLGSINYPEQLAALRHEWEVFLGQTFDDRDWFRLNRDFLRETRFFTAPAQEMWGSRKDINEKYLKRMAKQLKKGGRKAETTIQGNRSAQMMFKTSLRNHLDLSTLADNKANIMLSVNALILTIAAPLALTYVQNEVLLIIPLIMLLITCLASMIFATLATRPIKMTGYTDTEKIETGQSNLFFFGNFYDMDFEEYSIGMEQVISDPDKLESSIRRDLFFLGRSLGKKYNQLRTCYNIFMIGMIITIITMVATYSYTIAVQ